MEDLDNALVELRKNLNRLQAAVDAVRTEIRSNGYIPIPSDPFARYELEDLEVGGVAYHVWYDYYPSQREYAIRQLWGCPFEADTLQPITALHVDAYAALLAALPEPHRRRYIDGCPRDED